MIEDVIVLLDNFQNNKADVAIVDENNEITVFRDVAMSWDDTFYQMWNTPVSSFSARSSIDWGKLGSLFLEQWKPALVGIGYATKSIPDFAKFFYSPSKKDKAEAIANITKNLTEAILVYFPNENEQTSHNSLDKVMETGSSSLLSIREQWKDLPEGYKLLAFGEYITKKIFDILGEAIAELGKPEKQKKIEEAQKIIFKIDIPITTGIISLDDSFNQYYNRQRITTVEREYLRIDNIKFNDFGYMEDLSKYSNSYLSRGKVIYTSIIGRLETILLITDDYDGDTFEYLVSYNSQGEYLDCIRVGTIRSYAGDRGSCFIELDTVTYHSTYPGEGEDDSGESIYYYHIASDLKFVKDRKTI